MKALGLKIKSSFYSNVEVVSLLIATVLVGIAIIFVYSLQSQQVSHAAAYQQAVADMRVHAQELAKNSSEVVQGVEGAVENLNLSNAAFNTRWEEIVEDSVNPQGVRTPAVPARIETSQLAELWQQTQVHISSLDLSSQVVEDNVQIVNQIQEILPNMQRNYDRVVSLLVLQPDADPNQVVYAQRQQVFIERMLRTLSVLVEARDEEEANRATALFSSTAVNMGNILVAQRTGQGTSEVEQITDPTVLNVLELIQADFDQLEDLVQQVILAAVEMSQVRIASSMIISSADSLTNQLMVLHQNLEDNLIRPWVQILLVVLIASLLIMLPTIGVLLYRSEQKVSALAAEESQSKQNAILRLLDELQDLAEGDLGAHATVTEDFTGAIADSINFAIDQMRELVMAINSTAERVTYAAQQSQSTALSLADAAENQAQEIAGASAAINEMAVSIDQVSANAAESSVVAEKAVAISKKGADVVQATIHGMDTIREQIQDTSKRIKRLGESSQEIGDIVSLINDIADQTNILALNAAIQASMAGDAGRGFAVVADEVQRLAERSSSATKQIESLVKAIQSDTNEAVTSMEQTTSEVVRGARLAQDAGIALEEIENVSKSLAELIQNISNAARQQASSAGHISNTMNVIQEITSQTSMGTTDTAKGISDLARLAVELRSSVSNFKLPDDQHN